MKILILGITGMLGSQLFRDFTLSEDLCVHGTYRSDVQALKSKNFSFDSDCVHKINAYLPKEIELLVEDLRPDFIVNCVGIIKQNQDITDSYDVLKTNSLLAKWLEFISQKFNSKLIHFSTDCVFSGDNGNYSEEDIPDALDLYGISKYLGEVTGESSLTLRTSIIGHELVRKSSLIDWFLSCNSPILGYKNAIFSGLPTVEISRILSTYIFSSDRKIQGLLHLSGYPISKFDLLSLVAKVYNKKIEITPDFAVKIDRSLNGEIFDKLTGYKKRKWEDLIFNMKISYDYFR